MSNKEWYKESFDQVHIPEAVLGKVRNMEKEQKVIKQRNKLRYAVTMIAALVLFFAVSNGICYAATGESVVTWIDKGWSEYYDGEAVDIYKIGDEYCAISEGVDPKDCMDLNISEFMSDGHDDIAIIFAKEGIGRLVRDNKTARFYLFYGDFYLDITEDFADGKSSGTFELNGKQYEYIVTGTWTENWESVADGNWEDFHIQIIEK